MSKPTGVKLSDYCKAVEIAAIRSGYGDIQYWPNKGSAYSFAVFEKKGDAAPSAVWAVHVGHNKKKEVYASNIRKVWERTAIKKEVFLAVLAEII